MAAPSPFNKLIGPFVGVRDAVELAAQDATRASVMVNAAVPLPEIGTDVWQRAGMIERTVPTTITAVAFDGPTIGMAGLITSAGTFYNLLFQKGQSNTSPTTNYFADANSVAPASQRYGLVRYTAPSTFAYVQTSGGAFAFDCGAGNPLTDKPQRLFFISLGSLVAISASGGQVFSFNPATGAVASLSGAITGSGTGKVYGRPTIYYGCAFFTANSDRATIVWSSPNDMTTGYQQTGYANFWTLRQTSNAPIIGLIGTNDYLYVFRTNSITSVRGAPNIDFSSAATLEGVSSRIGTLAPDSITAVENTVWFLDQFARPHKIQPGRGVIPLWPNCANQCRLADLTDTVQFGNWGRHIPETELVVFRVAQASGNPVLMLFSSRTEEYLGTWSMNGYTTMDFGAVLYDSTSRPMLGVTNNLGVDTFVTQKADTATDQRDELAATAFPAFTVKTPRMQGDIDTAILPTRVTVSGQMINSVQPTVKVSYSGSVTAATQAAAMQQTDPTANAQPGRATADLGNDPNGDVPISGRDRYAQLQFTNDTADADTNGRITIGQVRLEGVVKSDDPTYP